MLKLLLGDPNARKLKRYQPIVSDINLLEEEIVPLSDDRTTDVDKTALFKNDLPTPAVWRTSGRSSMRSCQRLSR